MATLCAETNAILKLDLGAKGGIRRIALAKLWDQTTSRVSYQRLSEMALEHSNLSDSKLHCVTVTYTDEDGDTITISTDDELADAFVQFATRVPPIVRAKAFFDLEKDEKEIVKGLKQAVSEIGETAKKGGNGSHNKTKVDQMQGVLESFVTILTQAVESLSNNMDGIKQRKKNRSKTVPRVVRAKERDHKSCRSGMKENMDDIIPSNKTKETEAKDQDVPLEVEEKQKQKEEEEEYSNILPVKAHLDKDFIHGRHTCDGCLVTPIIGLRYHALNLPDHDLCQKCVLTHKGKDIIFEPTELERDRYLQNKWKRRQWRQNRSTVKSCGRPNVISNLAVCSTDTALKEAIRRSLADLKPNCEDIDESKNENISEQEDTTINESEKDNEIESVTNENQETKRDVFNQHNDTAEEEEEEVLAAENEEKNSVHIVESTTGEDEDGVSYSEEASNEVDDEDGVSYTGIVSETTASEPIDEVDTEESSVHQTFEDEVGTDVSLTSPKSNRVNESSFTEDAEGQGDVAIAIGMALDITANAIDSVLSEAEKPVDDIANESQPQAGCTILGSVNADNSNKDVEELSQTQSSVNSSDEWQLLNEDGKVTSDEMIAQAAQLLGSALFQSDVISDVTEVRDEYSMAMANDQSINSGPGYVGSVPTNVSTIVSSSISSTVLSRWDTELKQMHELGFLDDRKNVDALEHLEAASMGVDSDDPVTVNGAIDYLLSRYNEQN